MQPIGHLPEERQLLLEVDIDPAEENRNAAALILLVQSHGEVERNHEHFMPATAKFSDQGIIAETVSAVHPSGSRCDLDDSHSPCPDSMVSGTGSGKKGWRGREREG